MTTTLIEVMMRNAEGRAKVNEWFKHAATIEFRRSIFDRIFEVSGIKTRRFPRTDDMRQMLEDLGIEPACWDKNHFCFGDQHNDHEVSNLRYVSVYEAGRRRA